MTSVRLALAGRLARAGASVRTGLGALTLLATLAAPTALAQVGSGVAMEAPVSQGLAPTRLAGPEEANDLYAKALEHYEAGEHAAAEATFRRLLERGVATPNVLLGLGNAAYRQQRWAVAAYAYQWALELAPADEELRENLALVRERLVTTEVVSERSELAARFVTVLRAARPEWLLVPALALWTLGFALLAWRVLRRAEGATVWGVALVVGGLLVGAAGGWTLAQRRGAPSAVVHQGSVTAKSGPGRTYATLFTLHAGDRVRVEEERHDDEEERGGWLRVRVPGGPAGWLPASALALFGRPDTLPPLPEGVVAARPAAQVATEAVTEAVGEAGEAGNGDATSR